MREHLLMNNVLRPTYYIFCRRNKDWSNPELLTFPYNCLVFRFFYYKLILQVFGHSGKPRVNYLVMERFYICMFNVFHEQEVSRKTLMIFCQMI